MCWNTKFQVHSLQVNLQINLTLMETNQSICKLMLYFGSGCNNITPECFCSPWAKTSKTTGTIL